MSAESARTDTKIRKNDTQVSLGGSLVSEIHGHASSTYPEECCGLLLGRFEDDSTLKVVLGTRRMNNVFAKEERYHRYTIDPKEFIAVEGEAESNGLEIVGIYHSHPNAPAKPSEFDRNNAWPSLSYIVVEVRNSSPVATKSWLLKEDRSEFLPEEMIVVE